MRNIALIFASVCQHVYQKQRIVYIDYRSVQLSETLLSKDVCQIKTVAIWKTNNIVVYFWVVPHRNEHQKDDSLFSFKLSCKRLKVITKVTFNRRRIKRNVNKVWKMFSWNDSPGPPCTHAIPVSYRLQQTYFQSAIQSVFSICCCVLASIGSSKNNFRQRVTGFN